METIFKDFLEAISPALQELIKALVIIIIGQVSFYIKTKWDIAKVGMSSDKQYLLEMLAENAIETVQQVYESESNQFKKQQAIKTVEAGLKEYGISIDLGVIAGTIEAKLFRAKGKTFQPEIEPLG